MSLILTRRVGETIKIGDDIEVTITSINGAQVRVAIRAPKSVHILRSELKDNWRTHANEDPIGWTREKANEK